MDPNLLDWTWFVAGIGSFVMLLGAIAWVRRRRRGVDQALENAALDTLRDLTVPDTEDGAVHVSRVMLRPDGILVVDCREAPGNVFAADGMLEWTVIGERSRYTFQNPQTALYDRVAALRRLVPKVSVSGFILFGHDSSFPKGKPSDVLLVEEFLTRYPAPSVTEPDADVGKAWELLRGLTHS